MLANLIENKVVEYLKDATINDVETYKVVEVSKLMLDWNAFTDYPRIVVTCSDTNPTSIAIQQVVRNYAVHIFLLNFGPDLDDLLVERDIIFERIVSKLMANQRFDNLVDNNSNERVWDSKVGRGRFSKTGLNDSYHLTSWLQVLVSSERTGPFT
jgi:hypothetical protein